MLPVPLLGKRRVGRKAGTNPEVQHKDKTKKGYLPQDIIDGGRYLAANTVGDVWICYPWKAT